MYASTDGSGEGFTYEENCHITQDLIIKDYPNYGIFTGAEGYVQDVFFYDDSIGLDAFSISLCGKQPPTQNQV